jgi:hypothetical protein
MTIDKLHISNEMLEFDRKNRDFFDSLSEEEQKKFSPYLMIRWGSTVSGSEDMQAYYLMSVNEKLNKNFFDINTTKHKKFQWLLATSVSPGLGKQYHSWISNKKGENNNKAIKFLRELYPTAKDDELELLAQLNDTKELKKHARLLGWDDKRIKSDL